MTEFIPWRIKNSRNAIQSRTVFNHTQKVTDGHEWMNGIYNQLRLAFGWSAVEVSIISAGNLWEWPVEGL